MAKNAPKLSTMIVEKFEVCLSQMAKNALKLFTMVGENFEIHLSQMAKKGCKYRFCRIRNSFFNTVN
jgi:hypothetical protein